MAFGTCLEWLRGEQRRPLGHGGVCASPPTRFFLFGGDCAVVFCAGPQVVAATAEMVVTQPPPSPSDPVAVPMPAVETPTMPVETPSVPAEKEAKEAEPDASQSIVAVLTKAVRQLKEWASAAKAHQEQQEATSNSLNEWVSQQEQQQQQQEEQADPQAAQEDDQLVMVPLEQADAAPVAPQPLVRSWQIGPFTFVTSTQVQQPEGELVPRHQAAAEEDAPCDGEDEQPQPQQLSPIAAMIQRARAALHQRMALAAQEEADEEPAAVRRAQFERYWQHAQAQRQAFVARARAFWDQVRQERLAHLEQKYGANGQDAGDQQVMWSLGGGQLGPVLSINGDQAPAAAVSTVTEAKAVDPATLLEQRTESGGGGGLCLF